MSFWNLSTGQAASGKAEDSHLGSFTLIPDNTQAPAMIKSFVLDESGVDSVYKVQWKLLDGDFKGRVVFQSIKCFDAKDTVRDRNINMLKRIFDLLSFQLPIHAPTNQDLSELKGQVLGIKIGEWHYTGDNGVYHEGNNVKEVHKADTEFHTATGESQAVTGTPQSALTRNARSSTSSVDTDIPY